MATYKRSSPYFGTDQDNGYLNVIPSFRDVMPAPDDYYWQITPQYKNRPELLAHDLYQDVNLWWVFAARNKDIIRDPIYDMEPGLYIFVPQQASLKKALGL